MSTDKIMIETRDLTKTYGSKTAVDHLNLSVYQGEVFGLLGPNGAGKTTTILMLLGLTEPTEGEAFIQEMNCTAQPIEVKSTVGYLPDSVGFYSDMTGRENLAFTGRMNGLSEEEIRTRTEQLLEKVGLSKDADRKAGTYSRGMRQRLGIADVLMKDPQIVIMDEPTLGIDPEGMRELLSLIIRLSKEDGRTILISSHQLQQIQQICDRVGLFIEGQLIACGDIQSLGQQVQSENQYTLEMEISPCDDHLSEILSELPGVSEVRKDQERIVIESDSDLRKQITGTLGSAGYAICHLHQRGGDLDEIYKRYFEISAQGGKDRDDKSDRRPIRNIFKKSGK